LPLGTPPEILKAYGNTTIIATCAVGQKFEKEKIGYCYDDIQEALKAKNGLSFAQLREANVKRCEKSFHTLAAWSPTDWATAMAGECGEACNIIKKMRRIAATPEVVLEEQKDAFAYEELLGEAADELADLVTYVDLLAARLGVDLGQAIRRKFNSVSSRVKSDVKL
jgi:NTP pyrophosphatase (non-canonical NTP hydrolase)